MCRSIFIQEEINTNFSSQELSKTPALLKLQASQVLYSIRLRGRADHLTSKSQHLILS